MESAEENRNAWFCGSSSTLRQEDDTGVLVGTSFEPDPARDTNTRKVGPTVSHTSSHTQACIEQNYHGRSPSDETNSTEASSQAGASQAKLITILYSKTIGAPPADITQRFLTGFVRYGQSCGTRSTYDIAPGSIELELLRDTGAMSWRCTPPVNNAKACVMISGGNQTDVRHDESTAYDEDCLLIGVNKVSTENIPNGMLFSTLECGNNR